MVATAAEEVASPDSIAPADLVAALSSLTAIQLQSECEMLGLPQGGLKNTLLRRIQQHHQSLVESSTPVRVETLRSCHRDPDYFDLQLQQLSHSLQLQTAGANSHQRVQLEADLQRSGGGGSDEIAERQSLYEEMKQVAAMSVEELGRRLEHQDPAFLVQVSGLLLACCAQYRCCTRAHLTTLTHSLISAVSASHLASLVAAYQLCSPSHNCR